MIKKYKKTSIFFLVLIVLLSPLLFLTYEIEGDYISEKGLRVAFKKDEMHMHMKIVAEYEKENENRWAIKANLHPWGYIEDKRLNGYAVRSFNSLDLYLEGSKKSIKFTRVNTENMFTLLLKKWNL